MLCGENIIITHGKYMDIFDWYEWICHSYYSFNIGSSSPKELIEAATYHNYKSLGICDYDGIYGFIKAYRAAKELNSDIKLTYGCELRLKEDSREPLIYQDTIILKCINYEGYIELNKIITAYSLAGKHNKYLCLDVLKRFNLDNLICIIPMRGIIRTGDYSSVIERVYRLKNLFTKNLYLHVSVHLHSYEDQHIHRVHKISNICSIPILLSQDVYFHDTERKQLNDVQNGIRTNKSCYKIADHLFINSERTLNPKKNLKKRYSYLPFFSDAMQNSKELLNRFTFCPSLIEYKYPQLSNLGSYSSIDYLRKLATQSLNKIYENSIPQQVLDTLYKEIDLVEKLNFSDYFLTVWDIVSWAKSKNILCQGRGSAANSVICYALGITAINPIEYDLLFERFLNTERGDPPDIDVDFENERREEVIQYIYQKYGREKSAMVANIITYKRKSAIRATGKALGISEQSIIKASSESNFHINESSINNTWKVLSDTLESFPNHLGIHSGGFVLSNATIYELSPIEPASMDDRTVIQWAKDDLEYINCFKIDILSLGMLTALRKTIDYLKSHEGINLSLNKIPQGDIKTYDMIQKADTLGVFQIESRAQMSMAVRLKPKCFYDLIIQIGIIRPGPIEGGLIHPFLRRRNGMEKITYPHPKLEPILKRTLGIPIFQEQVMRIAIAIGYFSPGDADVLRKKIGSWSLDNSISSLLEKLKYGMRRHGIDEQYINQMIKYLKGFASYGFPESHAASFALISYASSYLKCHYPVYFYTALLNTQPMGFYNSNSILNDAKKNGIEVLPVSINNSAWDNTVVKTESKYKIRLGLKVVRGILKKDADNIISKRISHYRNFKSFLQLCKPYRNSLSALAASGALEDFGLSRRSAIWICEGAPYASLIDPIDKSFFPPESPIEKLENDFLSTGTSIHSHPCSIIKDNAWLYPINKERIVFSKNFEKIIPNRVINCFGHIVIKQSPYTAKGMVFITLEDEFGFINLVLTPWVYKKYQQAIYKQNFLCVEGKLQNQDSYISILVMKVFEPKLKRADIIEINNFRKLKSAPINTIKMRAKATNYS